MALSQPGFDSGTTPVTPHLLSPDELASYLGVPKETVYQWNHRRVGPPAIKVGRHLRYRAADVERWLDSQAVR